MASSIVRILAFVMVLCGGPAVAANYPERPVRIIVPTAPAGGADVLARIIGQQLGDKLGEQFFIDNRPGAGGIIGSRMVASAAPDGYTLLLAPSSLAITAAIKKKLPYDLLHDLKPIMVVASTPYALIVNPAFPVHSVKELIAYAKANPGELNYGSAGVGTASHFAAELFDRLADTKMTHVPNKGMGPAMIDVMGGQVSALFAGLPASLAAEKQGRVRVLAIASARRSDLLPDTPTIAEAGLPGYDVENWLGLLAPAGVDDSVIARLHDSVLAIVSAPETRDKLVAAGFEPVGGTPEQFATELKADVTNWGKMAEEIGISEK
jgi:tripartite-type tricarboxylate transporter receptor subunit TctC